MAWVVKVRLGDGVILGRKLKLNHISFSCGDSVGRVCESSIGVSDLDNMNRGGCQGAADTQGRESERCELHIGGSDEKDPDLLKENERYE